MEIAKQIKITFTPKDSFELQHFCDIIQAMSGVVSVLTNNETKLILNENAFLQDKGQDKGLEIILPYEKAQNIITFINGMNILYNANKTDGFDVFLRFSKMLFNPDSGSFSIKTETITEPKAFSFWFKIVSCYNVCKIIFKKT